MLHVQAVKAFNDNYLWVFHDTENTVAGVVDPGDAEPVLAYLDAAGLELGLILTTHHHADHIGGINRLLAQRPVPVYGPATARIPQVTHPVAEGDEVDILGHRFRILEVPGHTLEHIAWYTTTAATLAGPILFCGDTLFGAGCGRMFEGTPPMMHASLQKLAALAPETQVYCAHEYTLANLRFASAVMHDNAALQERVTADSATRERDQPTIPSTIALELATNPFLRCSDSEVLAAARREAPQGGSDPASVFGILRQWKDRF